MGCSPSKTKVRPVYKTLSDGPTVTRIFTSWGGRVRSPSEAMQIELYQTQDIGKTTALFVIRYTPDSSGATEEIIINGHHVLVPLSAAKALRHVFDNAAILNGLTTGRSPWFWMDCISINEADPAGREKQRRMEPYIYTIAKWTLDCTGAIAQIKLGTNAYQSAVVNFGGPAENTTAVGETLDNAQRLTGHIPGQVVWTASS